jgi:DNA-binding NtrC family response regulator
MPEARIPDARGLILIVDDEVSVLRLATSVLAEAGYRTVVAESAAAGLDLFKQLQAELSLVLVDIVMPGGSGLELADCIRQLDPSLKIVMMSGYSDTQVETQARRRYPFLRKPFLPRDLNAKVADVLA